MSADQVHYQNAVNIFLRIMILQYQVGCRNVACIFRFVKINVNNDAYGPMGCLLLRIAVPRKVTHRSKLLREIYFLSTYQNMDKRFDGEDFRCFSCSLEDPLMEVLCTLDNLANCV